MSISKFLYFKKILSPSIIVSILIFAMCGTGLAYTRFLSYKSSALIAFPLSIPEFKSMSERVESLQNFDTYASYARKSTKDKSDLANNRLERIRSSVIGPLSKWFMPALRVSKIDAKEFVGETSKLNEGSALVGYRIVTKASSPDDAQQQTALLADYVVDATLRDLLIAQLDQISAKNQLVANTIATEQATQNYNVMMLGKRLEQLKRISEAYPALNKSEARQVISLEKGGERYMPLPSQMAAVETEIMDIQEKLARNNRRLLQTRAEGEMLIVQQKLALVSTSGRELITALIVDTNARLGKSVEEYDKVTFLTYANEYADIRAKYFDLTRFIVAPELPEKPAISPFIVIFLFSLLGLVVGTVYEFRKSIQAFIMLRLNGMQDNALEFQK